MERTRWYFQTPSKHPYNFEGALYHCIQAPSKALIIVHCRTLPIVFNIDLQIQYKSLKTQLDFLVNSIIKTTTSITMALKQLNVNVINESQLFEQ